jgi:hypothetical protein
MAFPNISWNMIWAVAEVLVVQTTSSIYLYGYFRRELTTIERYGFLLAVLLGYTAIMRLEVAYTYLAYGLTIGLMAWVWLRPARVSGHVSGNRSKKKTSVA